MRTRRLRSSVLLLLTGAALVAPFSARADDQLVVATVGSTLGLNVSSTVTLANLLPGQTSQGTGTVAVVATGPWVLRLRDAASSNAGHLQRTVGSTGTGVLSNALTWSTSALHGTGGSGTLNGTATTAASGTLVDTVTVTYSQSVDSTEQLAATNLYGLTVTWTISAS
jgi:hypothetical protein